ncbi:MAG: 5-oxoprolinase subunit PxpA [Gemmatimonadaceae bacterium]
MNSTRSIDINADLGEHEGDGASRDAAMLDIVSSASIACGAHAGSREVMEMTVNAALERGVTIGAHPSYPDLEGFGRRETQISLDEIIGSFREQIVLLEQVCAGAGARLAYVKPHGALYNRAARDAELAQALTQCVLATNPRLAILALSGSRLESASRKAGLSVAREAFIDRAYMADGTLMPRDRFGAVITDVSIAGARALEMAKYGAIRAFDGKRVFVAAESLCVHGDSTHAIEIVSTARRRLEEIGITIAPFAT